MIHLLFDVEALLTWILRKLLRGRSRSRSVDPNATCPPKVVKRIDARAQLPRGSEGPINTCEASVGSFVDPRRTSVMDLFLGVAGSLQGENPRTSVPVRTDQTGARRLSVREKASKKPRIRLSSAGDGARGTSRSSLGDARAAPPVEDTIMVADDEVQPRIESAEDRPSAPSLGFQDTPLPGRSNVTPVTSSSGPFASPEPSPGGQRGPGFVSSSAQYFARNVCLHLDWIETRLTSRGQAAALEQKATVFEQKMEEILSLLWRLESSEAERTIVDLESKCARFEGDLEMAVAEIEKLKRERGVLMSRVEELEEENRRRREVARTVQGLLAESEPG
ncbi:hypothetical protein AXF42_Ash018613 [Apostasia shenzhenica]|uniref:Uncharacterized protein n=1 Tax=Apostasia shenzhenica TaxID=1088818 RepID=A0A2I0B1H3_9ASPA|nr:hypothetical protein AXF42_Ash018613 [Apostasia shenzhenica]